MNQRKKRLAFNAKVARIITLISFFHLSGLNNGFTQVAFMAGQMESFNFAPVAIEKTIQILNPKIWKQAVFGTPKVIEFASQRAVTRLLIESNLAQLCLTENLVKKFFKNNYFIHSGVGESKKGFKKALALERSLRCELNSERVLSSQRLFETLFTLPDTLTKDHAPKTIAFDELSQYVTKLKQQYWDKISYVCKQLDWNLQSIFSVQESKIIASQKWEGVENLKFKGLGYNRTKSGGDWVLSSLKGRFNENIPRSDRDVSFLGERV